jgi:hypothetical protein
MKTKKESRKEVSQVSTKAECHKPKPSKTKGINNQSSENIKSVE